MPPPPKSYAGATSRTRPTAAAPTIQDVRRPIAIVFTIWVAAACAADGSATTPTPAPAATAVAAVPAITPAPVGPPVRILWAPMQPQELPVPVRAEPSVVAPARIP